MSVEEVLWAVGIIFVSLLVYRDTIRDNKEIAEIEKWKQERLREEAEREIWWKQNKEKHW